MTEYLYIFGNGNLSFDEFMTLYGSVLKGVDVDNTHFIVCDFCGVDTLTMEFLKCVATNMSVYHRGKRPRYLPDNYKTKVGNWTLIGGFDSDSARDAAATLACTHFLAHDFNSNDERRSGTLINIENCLALEKTRVGEVHE